MTLNLTVTHRANSYSVELSEFSTLADLHAKLELLTSVAPSMQKLLYKGRKSSHDDTITLVEVGIKNGMKIQMLGSTAQEVDGLRAAEDQHAKVERIKQQRALKPQVKLRPTGSTRPSNYRFHRVAPLPHLPNPSSAQTILDKLANDPAILHVMSKHKFTVGLLTKLAPHELPDLLGINTNAGQEIKLRIRTNRYDGFRLYSDIRKVLCHELTHNVWGPHDENFKSLNSQLNREVLQFESAQSAGTHYLSSSSDPEGIYHASSDFEAEAQAYILGGSSSSTLVSDSREDMRRRMLEATMNRLRKEEEEVEMSCGTGKDISTTNPGDPSESN